MFNFRYKKVLVRQQSTLYGLLAILVVSQVVGCGIDSPHLEIKNLKVYADGPNHVDSCFAASLEDYTQQVYPDLPDYLRMYVVVATDLQTAEGIWRPAHTIVVKHDSRQLAVYGHELVRVRCFETKECDPFQSSFDWSGRTGELWEQAEDLAREMCG